MNHTRIIYYFLLALTLLSWGILATAILDPEFPLGTTPVLWLAILTTLVAGLWRWQQERLKERTQTPEQIISLMGGPLVGWKWRQEQINKTVHQYATQTAWSDLGIKSVGQAINLASHSIAGTVIAAGWAMKRKWTIYQEMPKDIAVHLLGELKTLPNGFALAASGTEEMLDLGIDFLFDHFISEALDGLISQALDDTLHELTLSDLMPILGPVKSAGVAYIYTWIVAFVYIAILFNLSIQEDDFTELSTETPEIIAASQQLLKKHLIRVGPLRIPIPWKEINTNEILGIPEIHDAAVQRLFEIAKTLRKQYPKISREEMSILLIQAQIPEAFVYDALQEKTWKKTRPNPFIRLEHWLWQPM